MKRLISIIAIMIVADAFAANPETRDDATSQYYVDYQLSNRQDTIPAKNGDKAVTPTGTKGQIGERDVKTTLGDETNNQSDTGITTVATVKAAVDNKQTKLRALPAGVNVVTYTGTQTATNNGGAGVVTTTPIYDKTTNTYGNGLVRAETLNEAVATGVSNVFTQIDENGNESNSGGLWRINAFTNPLPVTMYAQAEKIGTVDNTQRCYKHIDPGSNADQQGTCSTTMFNSMVRGDWGVTVSYETGITYSGTCSGTYCNREIRGISACTNQTFTGAAEAVAAPASLSSTLQTAYESSRTGATPSGGRCYCKVANPNTTASPWIYLQYIDNPTNCSGYCAMRCARFTKERISVRTALFGGVTPATTE